MRFLPQVGCFSSERREDGAQSNWRKKKRSRRRRCYEEARRRMRTRASNMADSRERRGRGRLQPPVVSSVRKGSGDSYTESSERERETNRK